MLYFKRIMLYFIAAKVIKLHKIMMIIIESKELVKWLPSAQFLHEGVVP